MKNTFKEIIRSFHSAEIPVPIPRVLDLPILPAGVKKAWVFIGMRRSGKTYAFYQIMRKLMSQNVDRTKIVYINFEDDFLCDMQVSHFRDILDAYYELYPDHLHARDVHFFFDEIHEVPGWEKFIRRLLDREHVSVYLTGSSSKMLSKEIATTLRGRTYTKEIFPFSFSEYLRKMNVSIPEYLLGRDKAVIMHQLQTFLKMGGFPEVIGASDSFHRDQLQSYMTTVIYRDIIERYGISGDSVLRNLLVHSLRNSATLFSITKMYSALKSMGYEVSKDSLYAYMNYFEDAYCIFSLAKYTLSQRKASSSMKKVFAVDQGLITAVTLASELNRSAQLETSVFAHLRRQSSEIYYYRTEMGHEVDFLCLLPDQSKHLYQVTLSLDKESTRTRELRALRQAMAELKLEEGKIITLDEEDSMNVPEGKILVMPAWKIFLGE